MTEPATAEPRWRSRFAEALRPLASRSYRLMWLGSTTSLVGAAIVGGVPAALTALVPGNRTVRRTRADEIIGPAGEIIGPAVTAAADPVGPAAAG